MEKKLEVRNLKISFRTQQGTLKAVRDISFDLYKGETLAIVGESGSGKSVTNRAIMGILAGNGTIDGGEIIYDGQDLVQISEEKFHKIRGDKIAMIFQDPMSSLNPIMKIGNQLTEAMLLKNSASRRNAKKLFNDKLTVLNQYMDLADPTSVEKNKSDCSTFDQFTINSTKLEGEFNTVHTAAEELLLDVNDLLFLIEKKQNVNLKKELKDFVKRAPKTVHPRVVDDSAKLNELVSTINSDISKVVKNAVPEGLVEHLTELSTLLDKSTSKGKPNFFCEGYYKMVNPTADLDSLDLEECNAMVRKYLDDNFMNDFITKGSAALQFAHNESIEKKKAVVAELESAIDFFKAETLEHKSSSELADKLSKLVEDAIDKLANAKNGVEYTFATSITKNIKKYFDGIKHNENEKKRFAKETAKYDRLVSKGKTPDWKVAPEVLFDLEDGKKAIVTTISELLASYDKDFAKDNFDGAKEMVDLIDYMKEQASSLVFKITKKTAKARAIKLMEEVGIPEPSIRYNQYPFEFSGGMRQRIVIAIALAANPDILICDEPTTALDVTIQAQILELINKLKEERHLSVIFITHNLGVVANMADRIAVMYAGKIVEEGTADEVFYDPKHPYTWALLSSMPDLDTKDKLEAIPGTPPNMIYPPVGDAFAARNKYALDIDFEMQPPMFEVSETHKAATWLLHPNAPHIDPPKIVTDRIERMRKKEAENNGK